MAFSIHLAEHASAPRQLESRTHQSITSNCSRYETIRALLWLIICAVTALKRLFPQLRSPRVAQAPLFNVALGWAPVLAKLGTKRQYTFAKHKNDFSSVTVRGCSKSHMMSVV